MTMNRKPNTTASWMLIVCNIVLFSNDGVNGGAGVVEAFAPSVISSPAAAAATVPPLISALPSQGRTTTICSTMRGRRSNNILRSNTQLYNLFDTMGDMLRGPKLEREENLPYDPPFSEELSIDNDEVRTFAIKERPISFTGEDFDIVEITNNQNKEFVRVRGAMLHLPGKDKMRLSSSSSGETFVTMDRVLIAATPSYNLIRNDGTKIGWIEKKLVSIMDSFDVYMEGKGGFGVTGLFKPTPAYRIEGDFLDRNFSFKNEQGQIVARANMDGWIQFDGMNHYQVQVAEGMDALFVLSCVCCIDEEFDEEHQKRREED